jgi:hypothetical protein
MAAAASSVGAQVTGFIQARQVQRTQTAADCQGLPGCTVMAQEGTAELLLERRVSPQIALTLRTAGSRDDAIAVTHASVREAFADLGFGSSTSAKLGRQVLTWGVSDFLFVNDIFPKDYDAFFTGAGFDRFKQPVDAVKLSARVGDSDFEAVLARSQGDAAPRPERFAAAAATRAALPADTADDRVDLALRSATHVGGWDLAAYIASYRSRERRYFVGNAGLEYDRPRQAHLGVSMAGNAASGLVWFEAAWRQAQDDRAQVVDRYFVSSALKAVAGYSREVGADVTATAQLQLETPTRRSSYLAALGAGIKPSPRTLSMVHLRLQGRWMNQTLGAGAQLFAGSEGDTHLNPFVNWSPADGWTLEGGAHVFAGKPETRFGALKDDSNVYVLGRYSF